MVSELKARSLSSQNTLGDSSHYSNNLKCYGVQNGLDCGSRWWLSGPRRRCQNSQNLMKSNDVGGIFLGRGMSRASKRAKEHSNRSSERKVVMKTVKKADAEISGNVSV